MFTRTGSTVTLQPAPGVTVTRGGKLFAGGPVQTDQEGSAQPDILQVGRFRFQLIARGDRIGVRIKDPEARARKEFKGIPTYPASARWRVTARWEPANPPTEIAVPNVLGEVERSPSPGTAVFTVDGKEYRLTPVLEEGSPDLFFVFADETNRTETYGAGRFLYAQPAKDGTVLLDFNRAYNPPCAFSAFATCPCRRSRTASRSGSTPGRSARRTDRRPGSILRAARGDPRLASAADEALAPSRARRARAPARPRPGRGAVVASPVARGTALRPHREQRPEQLLRHQ
jgi:uncharacterized protein (DUF1684 family)